MEDSRDLQLLLLALRDRVIDPNRLAVAAAEWSGSSGSRFVTFLADRGIISSDDLHHLEAMTMDLPAAVRGGDSSLQPTPLHSNNADVTTDLPTHDTPAVTAETHSTTRTRDRYQVLRLHQTGGLGQVWLARDSAVGRDVALKTLRPDRAAGAARRRFVHEARVTGQLEHPSIVPLYDLADGEGEPFYVMRFVTGRTLYSAATDYHKRRGEGRADSLELNALLDAFIGVCRAVAFAHSRNVLHRDLKGQNIVVGEYGEVFLLDWGLAKSVGDAEDLTPATTVGDDGECDVTAPGVAVGTPAYMAPEVAVGGIATKSSDVYGIGAILYSVLTGRSPYSGTTPEVLEKVATTDPVPVLTANPAAPAALAAICRKAMSRSPTDRYASTEEVATDVRRWLADEPVSTYREPWSTRLSRWARRRKTTVVAAAVLLLTTAIASAVTAGLVWREQQQTKQAWKQADAEKVKATENAATAIEVVRELGTYVHAVETGGARTPRTDEQRKQGLNSSIAAYERLLALNPDDPSIRLNVARMYRYRANLARLLNETPDAVKAYATATDHYDILIAAHPENLIYGEEFVLLTRDYGLFLRNIGRLKEATQVLDGSLSLYEKLHRSNPNNTSLQRTRANLLLDRSDLDNQLGRFADSERAARKSLEIYAKLGETPAAGAGTLDPMYWAMAQLRLAMALREQGRIDQALENHDAAVERLAKMPPGRDQTFQLHRARAERAWTWSLVPERREKAIVELDAAFLGFEKLAKEFPTTAFYVHYQGIAKLYRSRINALLGRRDAAVQDLITGTKLLEGLVTKYKDIPAYAFDLGRTYADRGRLADPREAPGLFAKARALLEPVAKQNPENVHYQRALEELNTTVKQ